MPFNPPPNWPPAPPGWTPEPGWQPDPAWGPPPPEWPLWVNDTATDTATPARRTTTALWIGLGAAVLVVAVAITAVLLTRGSGPATTSASGDDEPPITALSTSVLVDRSAFPIPGPHPQWQSMELDHAKEVIDPEDITGSSECKDLLYDTSYISGVFKRLAVEQPDAYIVLGVKLELGAKKYDVAEYVDKCANDRGAMNHGENTGAVRLSDLSGLPSWATAFSVEDSHAGETVFSQQSIVGYYREVKVSVDSACFGSGPSGVADDDLVGLFNDQVDKLAAAP